MATEQLTPDEIRLREGWSSVRAPSSQLTPDEIRLREGWSSVRAPQSQSTQAVDVMAVLNQNFEQLFPDVRAIKAQVKLEANLMEHPLETGALIADHRVILPVEIELNTIIAVNEFSEVYQQVKEIYLRGELITVQTRTDTYPSMVITSLPHEETGDMQDGIALVIQLREAKFVGVVYQDMKLPPPPKPAAAKNTKTKERGEQRPAETPEPRKGSYLGKMHLLGSKS